jgi:hypothetical protein
MPVAEAPGRNRRDRRRDAAGRRADLYAPLMRAPICASRTLMHGEASVCPDRRVRRCLRRGNRVVLDFAMIAAGIGFFVVAILYALACERM